MNAQIVLLLGQDGITSGAIYALLALSIVLVFSVTRVLLVPQGEFVVFGAMTMAALQGGKGVRLVWLLVAMALAAAVVGLWQAVRERRLPTVAVLGWPLYAAVLWLALRLLPASPTSMLIQAAITLALIVPIGILLYDLCFRPVAAAQPLVLLIVSIAVHSALVGLSLLMFGAEGAKTTPFSDDGLALGPVTLNAQTLWVIAVSALLVLGLFLAFERTLHGKALRATAVNALGAELMGISPTAAGRASFGLAAAIGALSGVLVAPITTLYFDSGFVISLKGFVGAIIGGLVSYPVAALGAVAVGLVESFSTFWASGDAGSYDAIVFGALIVFLMHRAPYGVAGAIRALWRRATPAPGRAPPVADAPALQRRTLPVVGSPVLEAVGVTRRFGGLVANRAIDLTLHAGEILAVIGPNGAGKSTLFNQLSCCDVPSEGHVRFLGADVSGGSAQSIAAAGVCRTFQHVKLMPSMSVLENVAIGAHLRGASGWTRCALRADRAEERRLLAEAKRQAERVGLGLHLHADAGSLSLGQQRLVEIARALAADPSALLLDEPAAGLRHLEKAQLAALLRALRAEGLAVLLVEHDMDFVMGLVDRVAVVVFGEKIVEGTPTEVQRDARVLEAYLGAAP